MNKERQANHDHQDATQHLQKIGEWLLQNQKLKKGNNEHYRYEIPDTLKQCLNKRFQWYFYTLSNGYSTRIPDKCDTVLTVRLPFQ